MYRTRLSKKDSSMKLRLIGVTLFIIFLSLQVSLWGERGLLELWTLHRSNAQEKINNEKLGERNQILINELADLKSGGSVLEELAREDLGMVKPDETFFKVIENQHIAKDTKQ